LAWQARGRGSAATVTEEGWREFREKIEETRKLVVPIADSDNPPPETFTLLFAVAMAQSWDREEVDKYVEKLMKVAPRHSSAHMQVVQLLMPRWGGKPGDSEAYAARIADRIGGAAGDAIYARCGVAQRKYYSPESFLEVTGFDGGRIHKGIAHLAAESPDDLHLLLQGLMLAAFQKDQVQAKVYATKVAPRLAEWPMGLWAERNVYLSIMRWATGSAPDVRLEPGESRP
jgi:hypothetical protein